MIGSDIAKFANPGFLWLLLLILPMIAYYVYRCLRGGASIRMSTVEGIGKDSRTARYYLRHLPFILRCMAVALLIVAMARPQSMEFSSTSTTEGIDIMLSVDVSGSMLARDFKPDRMTAAKETAAQFIVDRPNDRIGIVVFAGESYTQSPLTTDKRTLQYLITQVGIGVIDDGTAIGSGLATAINRLKESDAESKVIILLTDGVNNSGQIAPMTAAEIARTYGIRVYTIGIGSEGMAPMPFYDRFGNTVFHNAKVEIDEKLLADIAAMTGGEYFRATDNASLSRIYDRINELEKTTIETNEYTKYHELFRKYALIALLLLSLEFVTRRLVLRRIP